jgi:hypothetical protein
MRRYLSLAGGSSFDFYARRERSVPRATELNLWYIGQTDRDEVGDCMRRFVVFAIVVIVMFWAGFMLAGLFNR